MSLRLFAGRSIGSCGRLVPLLVLFRGMQAGREKAATPDRSWVFAVLQARLLALVAASFCLFHRMPQVRG